MSAIPPTRGETPSTTIRHIAIFARASDGRAVVHIFTGNRHLETVTGRDAAVRDHIRATRPAINIHDILP